MTIDNNCDILSSNQKRKRVLSIMKQSTLARWLRVILVGVLICGLTVYFFIVPSMGQDLVISAPEFESWYMPWLLFISGTSLPCAAGFVFAWLITVNIGRDRSFSAENSRYLKYIAILAAVDAAYFFVGNVIFLSLNMSHPGVVLLSLMIVFAATAVAVAAAALSHLVYKAALLQEESDLTI